MASDNIEELVLDGWTVESEHSAIEGARYFRNGFLAIGLGSMAVGTAALAGHDLELGFTAVVMSLPISGAGVWFESLRSRASERLAVLERISSRQESE